MARSKKEKAAIVLAVGLGVVGLVAGEVLMKRGEQQQSYAYGDQGTYDPDREEEFQESGGTGTVVERTDGGGTLAVVNEEVTTFTDFRGKERTIVNRRKVEIPEGML